MGTAAETQELLDQVRQVAETSEKVNEAAEACLAGLQELNQLILEQFIKLLSAKTPVKVGVLAAARQYLREQMELMNRSKAKGEEDKEDLHGINSEGYGEGEKEQTSIDVDTMELELPFDEEGIAVGGQEWK